MRSSKIMRFVMAYVGVSSAALVGRSALAEEQSYANRSIVVVNQAAQSPSTTPANDATTAAPSKPGFNGFADLEGAVTIATGVSTDKQAMTVLFRNLEASVDAIKSGPLVDIRTITVLLPLEKQDKDVGLTIDIRGFVELHDSTGTIVVQAPGNPSRLFPITDAQEKAKTDVVKKQLKPGLRRERDKSNGGRDFICQINNAHLKAGAVAKITFVLMVDRDFANTSCDGLIEIDSLDISIQELPTPAATNAPAPPAEAPKPAG